MTSVPPVLLWSGEECWKLNITLQISLMNGHPLSVEGGALAPGSQPGVVPLALCCDFGQDPSVKGSLVSACRTELC